MMWSGCTQLKCEIAGMGESEKEEGEKLRSGADKRRSRGTPQPCAASPSLVEVIHSSISRHQCITHKSPRRKPSTSAHHLRSQGLSIPLLKPCPNPSTHHRQLPDSPPTRLSHRHRLPPRLLLHRRSPPHTAETRVEVAHQHYLLLRLGPRSDLHRFLLKHRPILPDHSHPFLSPVRTQARHPSHPRPSSNSNNTRLSLRPLYRIDGSHHKSRTSRSRNSKLY